MKVEQAPGPDQVITEIRRTEQQLAEALALAHVGSWHWDLVTDRLTVSDEHNRIFGLAVGRPTSVAEVFERIDPRDRANVKRVVAQALQDGKPYTCEFRVRHADGTERIVEARTLVELDDGGRPLRKHGTAQDITERRRAEDMRRHLLARAISAQEEERRRVARELHDETGQALSAILVGLRSLEESPTIAAARTIARRLRDLAAVTVRDVGRIARGLRPSVLDDLGLLPALRRYAEELGDARQLTVRITDDGCNRLPPEIETTLYRIIQEALTNVARHAHAGGAEVGIARHDGRVRAVIRDDGIGFDVGTALAPTARRQALGLMGIEERAALVGGRVEITSSTGAGTSITVDLPLQAP
jgi:two-component system sensor histidine kinase UhpB